MRLSSGQFFGQPHFQQQYAPPRHQRTISQSNLSSVNSQSSQQLPKLSKKWGDPKNLEKLMELRADKLKSFLKRKQSKKSKNQPKRLHKRTYSIEKLSEFTVKSFLGQEKPKTSKK